MHRFHDKLIEVRDRVQRAAERANRNPEDITILAVSKTRDASRLREAYTAGQHLFGENYLQEALEKQNALSDLNIEWHFIGPIQSNKTKPIAEHFTWVHSIDREKIATRLNEHRSENNQALNVCIQVKIDDELSKSGVPVNEAEKLARSIGQLPHLKLQGLMAIPLARKDYQEQCNAFQQLQKLRDSLQQKLGYPLPTLSMGMSNDLEAAIACGATLIRIGTDLFGPREKKTT